MWAVSGILYNRMERMDTYRVMHFGASIGIGVSGAIHLGIAAVGKPNSPANPYVLSNEVVAATIGQYLRLPIPPFCVITGPTGENHFASLSFNLVGGALPPIIPAQFYTEFEALVGALIAFDVYIANCDRHNGNLSADYGAHRFNVFDHSHCLLSGSPPLGSQRLARAETSLVVDGSIGGGRHCLINELRSDRLFETALSRIESIPDWFIEEVVNDTVGYGITPAEANDLIGFLKNRRQQVRPIIAANKGVFAGVTNWVLL